MESFDAIIVGAGPAGLTAATYLGRFRRRALVLDGGPSRAGWIPESHNTPGFPEGVGGPELLARFRAQAERYGAQIRQERADTIQKASDGYIFPPGHGSAKSSFIILATGLIDRKPGIPGVDEAIRASLVRVCPICDAYEAIDQRIAVLGDGEIGVREALFLRTYSDRVTLLHLGAARPSDRAKLKKSDVELVEIAVEAVSLHQRTLTVASSAGEPPRTFDCLYLALGCEMESRLAIKWGAVHDAQNNLIVDAHQQTSIDGLYAAGDVVLGLNQIAIATAEAALAATAIHNRLRIL